MIKSSVLTITIPNVGCNKNCPYCVSRMTNNDIPTNKNLFYRNIRKAKTVATAAGVTSVLFTGKGEPLLNAAVLLNLATHSYLSEWPMELQTNGFLLNDTALLYDIIISGINVVAISIDDPHQFEHFTEVFDTLGKSGIITRITLNISDRFDERFSFQYILNYCKKHNIRHITYRRISIPFGAAASKESNWIVKHNCDREYEHRVKEAKKYIDKYGKLIRTTNYGMSIYDCDGIAFVHSDYCIQEESGEDDIRSLIYQEDGHLYTSWNSRASIIF